MVALPLRRFPLGLIAAGLALVPGAGCGGDEPSSRAPRPSDAGDETPASTDEGAGEGGGTRRGGRGSSVPDAEATGELSYASQELGALHGEIRITGEVPERFPLGAKDKVECGHHPDVEHLSDRVVAQDGKLLNVYVHLRLPGDFDESAIPPAPEADVVLDQRGCIYTPHVVALQAGQTLLVANSDPTSHNVNYSAPRNGASGNRTMGQGQAPLALELARPEEKIRFKCDIHPWMGAWAFVEEHPWFAVSGPGGRFEIRDVPPGTYTVEAVHEHYGEVRARVTVEAGKSKGIALTFAAD